MQITYFVICIIEAKLEQFVIAGKQIDVSQSIDRLEHQWSAVYSISVGAAIVGLTAYFAQDWRLLFCMPAMFPIRRTGFDFLLKIFRDRPWRLIEGNGTIDKTSRRIFGRKGGYIELCVCMSLLIGYNYLLKRFL